MYSAGGMRHRGLAGAPSAGHGRALLEAFMAAGRSAGASKMFLHAAEANRPARRLYDSMGGGLAAQGPTVNYWFQLR